METKLPLTIIDNQQLHYENEVLKIAVLGGVKLEGLDRLRVTLKVELKDSPRPALRHNMDAAPKHLQCFGTLQGVTKNNKALCKGVTQNAHKATNKRFVKLKLRLKKLALNACI